MSETRIVLKGRALVLGSHPACDVVVDGLDIAPHHACLWVQDGSVVVSDLGSGRPTRIEGRTLTRRATVASGAVLRVGQDAQVRVVVGALDADRPFVLQIREQPELAVTLAESHGRRSIELAEGRSAELAWILARQVADDAARGLGPDRLGWVYDGDLAARLWGARGAQSETHENSLNVCVFRLRSALEEAGFPRRLVEKRSRRTRFCGRLVGLAS